jgi:rRNA-processing protein FCF1
MPSLRDQFAHFYAPDGQAVARAMKVGLVVPDANVLLNLYRFQATARDELLGALGTVSDRLWIPYQVGLEFHRNRLGVMKEQEEYFNKTLRDFHDSTTILVDKIRAFKRRLALSDDHVREIEDAITSMDERVGVEILKAGEFNEVSVHGHAYDSVLARIDVLFENRVGVPMEPKELEEAKQEAEKRVTAKIPPGYMDRRKVDPTGDYLVWRQLLTEAADRKLPVVFITDDTKDDWYQREHGLTLGARRELREEMTREAGVSLLIMTTETFLRHAKIHLAATVSEETVDQAKELPPRRRRTVVVRADAPADWTELAPRDPEFFDLMLKRIQQGRLSEVEVMLAASALAMRSNDSEAVQRAEHAIREGLQSGALPPGQAHIMVRPLARLRGEQAKMAAIGQFDLFGDDDESYDNLDDAYREDRSYDHEP